MPKLRENAENMATSYFRLYVNYALQYTDFDKTAIYPKALSWKVLHPI